MSWPSPVDVHDQGVRFKRLQKACEITLERYTVIANDSCNLMGKIKALPVARDKRLEIFLQKKKEDQAYCAYQKARTALFAAIQANLAAENSEPPSSADD